jgi:hypothetical protein
MKKTKFCRVSNCKNKSHGVICTTHRYRWNSYNSYDLPSYKGEPNYLADIDFPNGIVKFCNLHGYLTIEQVYTRRSAKAVNDSYACKRCCIQRNRKKNYQGIETEQDYLNLLESHNHVCAICKKKSLKLSNNSKTFKSLSVDHCHKTNKVRGLLCDHCNQGIGHFFDNIDLLQAAIDYLST